MQVNYKYTKADIEKLKNNITILVDKREQQNKHITDHFDKMKISWKPHTLDHGDYTIRLNPFPELGFVRECFFKIAVERKNSVDELVQSIKDRERFKNEFSRSRDSGTKMILLIEDPHTLKKMYRGDYRSQYHPNSLVSSYDSFVLEYDLRPEYVDKEVAGPYIYKFLIDFMCKELKR